MLRPSVVVETLVKPEIIVNIANSQYAETYFGINDTQAAASGLNTYSPSAGIKSAGVQIDVMRMFTNKWSLLGQIKYERMLGDAADSPIVLDENQYALGLAAVYEF